MGMINDIADHMMQAAENSLSVRRGLLYGRVGRAKEELKLLRINLEAAEKLFEEAEKSGVSLVKKGVFLCPRE